MINAEARFKDGEYNIHFVLGDLVSTGPAPVVETVRVVNFARQAAVQVGGQAPAAGTPQNMDLGHYEYAPALIAPPTVADTSLKLNVGDAVGVQGSQFYPNLFMNAYVVKHKPVGWKEDDPLTDGMVAKIVVQSDANGVVPLTQAWTAQPGEYDVVIDYENDGLFSWKLDGLTGFHVGGVIGDRVWEDKNLDGLQSGNEPGLAGVSVSLYTAAGQLVGSPTTTDANGYYLFTDVDPGNYYLQFGTPDDNWWRFTLKGGTPGAPDDSDVNRTGPLTGRTDVFTLALDMVDRTRDAGLYKLGTIGNWVWHDYYIGGDGIQNDNLGGISGLAVTLLDADGNVIRITTTDANGNYLFDKLEQRDADWNPIQYKVQFTKPADYSGYNYTVRYIFAPKDAGPDDVDSDADPATGLTDLYTLNESGEVNDTIDCGIEQMMTSGPHQAGTTAFDVETDGQPDAIAAPQTGFGMPLRTITNSKSRDDHPETIIPLAVFIDPLHPFGDTKRDPLNSAEAA